ncbi:MAG: glycoside hydrolase domain-containing protein [Phycisphaerae bacterium]
MKKLLGTLVLAMSTAAMAANLDLFVTDYNENPTADQKALVDQPTAYVKPQEVIIKTADGQAVTVKSPLSVSIRKEAAGNPREAKLFASPGEYEPFSFTLRPRENLQEVMIAGGELKGPDGAAIPAGNVVVRSVEGFQGGGFDILMPLAKPWNMGANSAEHFWCTVKVPADAKPGQYKGDVTVTAEGKPVGAIAIVLDVLPIKLAEPPFALGFNYSKPNKDADGKILAAQLADMREHGMTTVAPLYNWHMPVHDADTSELGNLLEAFKKAGFPATFYWAAPMDLQLSALAGYGAETSRRWQQKYIKVMRLMHEEVKKHGVPAIFSIGDELTNKGIEGVRIAGNVARFAWEELPEIATTSDMNGYMEVMAMAPYLNVATFNNGWDGIDNHNKGRHLLNKAFLEELQAKTGAIPWFVNADRGRFPFGLFFWKMTKYGVRGKVEWYYNLGDNERGSLVRTEGAAVHPTLEYERSREGIDDLKYVLKLESLIAEAAKAGKAKDQCAKAQAALKTLLDAIADDWTVYQGKNALRFPDDGFGMLDPEKTASFGKLNNIRLEIVNHILAIQAAMGS